MNQPNQPTSKAPFKFKVENALTVTMEWAGFFSPAAIESVASDQSVPDCNIYFICRRPRVSIETSSFMSTVDSIKFTVLADWGDGEPAEMQLEGPNLWGEKAFLESTGAPSELRFLNEEGHLLAGMDASMFLSSYLSLANPLQRLKNPVVDENFLDLDVVYVGQSLQAGGAQASRLLNHATLQKVLAETLRASPHLEVQIVIARFSSYNKITTIHPSASTIGLKESVDHLRVVGSHALDVKELTALVEAGLIRYFQPPFNSTFKDSFPKPLHKSYSSVYGIDYHSIGFEFETLDPIGARLKSGTVEPSFVHTALFYIRGDSERKDFFDLWD